ncbi:MAG TPA: glutamine amidotransferase, partial [Planctomycetaceae bacterium]|nr:glutamine amidotransferase [Planctomycetaceae bacterium]
MMLAVLTFLTPLTGALTLGLIAVLGCGFVLLRWLSGQPAAASRRAGLTALRTASVITVVVILLNPSNVTQSPGTLDRPDMFYLLDSSQSMAVGDQETRFAHATRLMREASQLTAEAPSAKVRLFRFGHRLAAVPDAQAAGLDLAGETSLSNVKSSSARSGEAFAAPTTTPVTKPIAPSDSDTQLLTALRQVSSRFGRRPPAGVVLFSDGRARDETGAETLAKQFARLNIPVHVVPVGETNRGGDVSIVACVVPPRVRRFSDVEVQVFLRSYGFEGRRCEVTISAPPATPDEAARPLAPPTPVTLHDGFQTVGLTFRSDPKTRKLEVAVSTMPNEVSTTNNIFKTEVAIDRTKIRVLYIEGSAQPLQAVQRGERSEVRGPYSDLQQALIEDDDIECVVLHAPYGRSRLQRLTESGAATSTRGFPDTIAELTAFDAIILSDIGANAFTEQQLGWIDQWIGQRGGGLLMVGGPRSFASGGWDDTPIAPMLPITMRDEGDWLPGTQVSVRAEQGALSHPLWALAGDARRNQELVARFPSFFGANRWQDVKPNFATVLALSNLAAADPPPGLTPAAVTPKPTLFDSLRKNLMGNRSAAPVPITPQPEGAKPASPALEATAANQPAIAVGRYGRGRTMAMAVPITSPWANEFLTSWGGNDGKAYGRFWRNAVYWLTESSSVGRRRLVVTADKKFYRPGEMISLNATAFDEAAQQTGSYKIASMIEPQSSLNDLESNDSPIRWPTEQPRSSGETGPFVVWGEEFNMPRADAAGGKPTYALQLPIADALSVGSASQSLRVELTAMEEYTQVDS